MAAETDDRGEVDDGNDDDDQAGRLREAVYRQAHHARGIESDDTCNKRHDCQQSESELFPGGRDTAGLGRLAFSRGSQGQDSLFANGREYLLPSEEAGFLPVITRYRELHFGYLEEWLRQTDYLQLVCDLFNDGHFEFSDA